MGENKVIIWMSMYVINVYYIEYVKEYEIKFKIWISVERYFL